MQPKVCNNNEAEMSLTPVELIKALLTTTRAAYELRESVEYHASEIEDKTESEECKRHVFSRRCPNNGQWTLSSSRGLLCTPSLAHSLFHML